MQNNLDSMIYVEKNKDIANLSDREGGWIWKALEIRMINIITKS